MDSEGSAEIWWSFSNGGCFVFNGRKWWWIQSQSYKTIKPFNMFEYMWVCLKLERHLDTSNVWNKHVHFSRRWISQFASTHVGFCSKFWSNSFAQSLIYLESKLLSRCTPPYPQLGRPWLILVSCGLPVFGVEVLNSYILYTGYSIGPHRCQKILKHRIYKGFIVDIFTKAPRVTNKSFTWIYYFTYFTINLLSPKRHNSKNSYKDSEWMTSIQFSPTGRDHPRYHPNGYRPCVFSPCPLLNLP